MAHATAGHVLIVDDEPEIRALLRSGLEQEGFIVLEAGNGAEAETHLASTPIDLVTLDLKLGGEDGLKVARDLRTKRNTPIVMITGKGDPIDRVVGLELGADDYIAKPFLMREVVARIRAVLRRYSPPAAAEAPVASADRTRLTFDGWIVDIERREVLAPGGAPCGADHRRIQSAVHSGAQARACTFARRAHGPVEGPRLDAHGPLDRCARGTPA